MISGLEGRSSVLSANDRWIGMFGMEHIEDRDLSGKCESTHSFYEQFHYKIGDFVS